MEKRREENNTNKFCNERLLWIDARSLEQAKSALRSIQQVSVPLAAFKFYQTALHVHYSLLIQIQKECGNEFAGIRINAQDSKSLGEKGIVNLWKQGVPNENS